MEEECIFCKIVKGEIESERIHESDNFIVIKDKNPKVKNHSLVIPKDHYPTFFEMPSSVYEEFLLVTKEAAIAATSEIDTNDFNLVMNNGESAGQIISHAHLHILPRKKDDGFGLNV